MKKIMILISLILLVGILSIYFKKRRADLKEYKIEGVVLNVEDGLITIKNKKIYKFRMDTGDIKEWSDIIINYQGKLDDNKILQKNRVVSYEVVFNTITSVGIPFNWLDNGIFSEYYKLANDKLKKLNLEEKIGQLLLVRYPDKNAKEILKEYKFGGYIFFEKDFKNKTETEVKKMIDDAQSVSNIPLLIAVDEEGGKVVRVSSNPNLASSRFKSSRELYLSGGFDKIKQDTIYKSSFLSNLKINFNLAPVIDVSTSSNDYMYSRSLGENAKITAKYAEIVIKASKGTSVSYALKHFPGYGNNNDTHTGKVIDNRSYEDIINNDIVPFKAGIESGAEAVLVSHNIVSSIDSSNPASLSLKIHNLLRDDLSFTGIIVTDDLVMGATKDIPDATLKAIQAGNDLIITTDYLDSINSIKRALNQGVITEETLDKLVFKILAWKYYKGLMKV